MSNLFRSIALSRNLQDNLATEALHHLLQRTPDSLRETLRARSINFAAQFSKRAARYLAVGRMRAGVVQTTGFSGIGVGTARWSRLPAGERWSRRWNVASLTTNRWDQSRGK